MLNSKYSPLPWDLVIWVSGWLVFVLVRVSYNGGLSGRMLIDFDFMLTWCCCILAWHCFDNLLIQLHGGTALKGLVVLTWSWDALWFAMCVWNQRDQLDFACMVHLVFKLSGLVMKFKNGGHGSPFILSCGSCWGSLDWVWLLGDSWIYLDFFWADWGG